MSELDDINRNDEDRESILSDADSIGERGEKYLERREGVYNIENLLKHIAIQDIELSDRKADVVALGNNIISLLNQVGDPGVCKGCGKTIWWVKHLNGKKAPYTEKGLNHFADCPQANKFKKG